MDNSGNDRDDILISVIVPVYNVIDYLNACIDSLLCQTYTNIEIIIIDDGSTDGCSEVIDEYASRDKRIKAIHTVNSGLSAARNVGIDASGGDYIMFVDSDDYVEKDFCQYALRTAIAFQVDLVSFGYDLFWAEDNRCIEQKTNNPRLLDKKGAIRELVDRKDVIYNFAWNKIYRRHLFDGIRFPVGRTLEDMAIMLRVFDRLTTGIYVSDRVLYHYRQGRKDSIMAHAKSPRMMQDRVINELDRFQFIKDNYPDLEPFQIEILVGHCMSCYLYMPKDNVIFSEIDRFMNENKGKILAAHSGLRRFRIQSYYFLPLIFRLINAFLRKSVYHIH